jgi:hypothetical protein
MSIGKSCTLVSINLNLPVPNGVTITRASAASWTNIHVQWNANAGYQSFTLSMSTNPLFPNNNHTITIANIKTTHVALSTIQQQDIRQVVHYVKIHSVGNDATQISKESPITTKWKNIGRGKSCSLDKEYLNCSSLDPFDWDCVECPQGGSCSGSIVFEQVEAMFGWSSCTTTSKTKTFARCMFPPACKGGANPALSGKYFNQETMDRDPALCVSENCTETCNTAYVNGSRLCGQCATHYSHVGLTGQCNACPPPGQNTGVAVGGVLAGMLCIFVFIQITLSDGGSLDESDGAKSIGLSFIQLISLLVTFPIAW